MAPVKKPKIEENQVQGLKLLKPIEDLLAKLHDSGTERDRAHNRKLHYDQYVGLLLLYFYNPIITSLRGIQQASELKKVQRMLGCSRASLGSLSEATAVFDPQVVEEIVRQLAAKVGGSPEGIHPEALKGLCAVDGTLLPALPRMAWALWQDSQHRAAKMHLIFEVFRGIPLRATITEANASETAQLRGMLEADRLYVMDRGYGEYRLFQEIIDRGSSFIARLRQNAVLREVEERELTEEAKAAGVLKDSVASLGAGNGDGVLRQRLRLVEVRTGRTDDSGAPEILLLVTDKQELPAELVALGYRHRWAVELFFRWYKCILSATHLLSNSRQGVEIQAYVALIASLLISLWTGHKPTKRTFEMIQLHQAGWADDEELEAHIARLRKHEN